MKRNLDNGWATNNYSQNEWRLARQVPKSSLESLQNAGIELLKRAETWFLCHYPQFFGQILFQSKSRNWQLVWSNSQTPLHSEFKTNCVSARLRSTSQSAKTVSIWANATCNGIFWRFSRRKSKMSPLIKLQQTCPWESHFAKIDLVILMYALVPFRGMVTDVTGSLTFKNNEYLVEQKTYLLHFLGGLTCSEWRRAALLIM